MNARFATEMESWPSDRCIKLLRRIGLFERFEYSALRALMSASRLLSLKKSRRLFRQGDAALSGYVLADGVLSYSAAGSGEPAYLTPPAMIGEMALIVDTVRPATVIAETYATVIEIPRSTFLRVVSEYPDSAAQARALISRRLRRLVGELDAVRPRFEAPADGATIRAGEAASELAIEAERAAAAS